MFEFFVKYLLLGERSRALWGHNAMRDTQVRDASRWRLSVSVIDWNAHFVFPEFIFFDKCIENRESLPHAGDESDFLLFALGEQMLVVALDSLIEACCH